jgi:hypothetical protein
MCRLKLGIVLPIPNQDSVLPADPGLAVIHKAGPSDDIAADIALAMSAAPFAGSIVNANTGDTSVVAEHDVSDYGTDGTGSKSQSIPDIQENGTAGEEDFFHTDSNDIVTIYDGIHSDLFEDLFQTLPIGAPYRALGQNPTGCFGPLLLSDQDQPNASQDQLIVFSALVVFFSAFLSALYHHLTFKQRADLLYVHWDALHAFKSVLEIKT